MNSELYAKVKGQARYCRDLASKQKLQLFLEVIRSGRVSVESQDIMEGEADMENYLGDLWMEAAEPQGETS